MTVGDPVGFNGVSQNGQAWFRMRALQACGAAGDENWLIFINRFRDGSSLARFHVTPEAVDIRLSRAPEPGRVSFPSLGVGTRSMATSDNG